MKKVTPKEAREIALESLENAEKERRKTLELEADRDHEYKCANHYHKKWQKALEEKARLIAAIKKLSVYGDDNIYVWYEQDPNSRAFGHWLVRNDILQNKNEPWKTAQDAIKSVKDIIEEE